MNTLLIFAHPWSGSFNTAVLKAVEAGLCSTDNSFEVIDLYRENFNPVLSEKELALYDKGKTLDPKVREYQKKIDNADHLFFIFPIWWEVMPAMLKGFIDKVILPGWGFDISKSGMFHGKFKGKSATVITTMNVPGPIYNILFKAPIKHGFISGVLKMCGIKKIKWFELSRVDTATDKKRRKWLDSIEKYASTLGSKHVSHFRLPELRPGKREYRKAA